MPSRLDVKTKAEMTPEELHKRDREWVRLARQKHKDTLMKDAKRFLARLRQEFAAQTDDTNQSVFNSYVVNLRRLVPELLPKNIKVTVMPMDGDTIIIKGPDGQDVPFDNKRAAIILDNKLNRIFDADEVKYTLKSAVYDLLVANMSCVVVGQDTKITEVDEEPPEARKLLAEKARNGDAVPGERPIKKKRAKVDKSPELVIMRESYENVAVDPSSTGWWFADSRFKVRMVPLPPDEAKERFPEQYKAHPDNSYQVDLESPDANDNKSIKDMEANKRIPVYELYDYTGEQVMRRLYFGGELKYVNDAEFGYDPLAMCKINYIPNTTYPPSDMRYYEPLVDEMNFYGTVAMNQADRSAARKVLYDGEAVDAENQEKLRNSKDMELVRVDTRNRSIRDAVFVEKGGSVSADILDARERAAGRISILSEVGPTQMGVPAKTPATNAMLANQPFMSATSSRLDLMKDYIGGIADRAIAVLKEISLEAESFTLEKPNGVRETIKWSQPDIKYARVRVEVNLEAAQPNDVRMVRMQNFVNWLFDPLKVQMLAREGKKINAYGFVKEVGKFFIPDADFDKLIVDDAADISPEAEILLMLGGRYVAPRPEEDFREHLESHQAFMEVHPIYQSIPPEVQQLFQQHVAETKAIMQEQERLAKEKRGEDQKPAMEGQVAGGAANAQPGG